ncbi:hypothetical protein OG21DRAFT_172176 [Imleria badia]|nr:hypothetical protein OG21DRAFT_172176 [Imleria badia]
MFIVVLRRDGLSPTGMPGACAGTLLVMLANCIISLTAMCQTENEGTQRTNPSGSSPVANYNPNVNTFLSNGAGISSYTIGQATVRNALRVFADT